MTSAWNQLAKREEQQLASSHASAPAYRAVNLGDFLETKLPPRRWLLKGLLQEKDTMQVHAYRGVGKSMYAHGVAYALATGGSAFRYEAPKAAGVLIVDGELPLEELQVRFARTVAMSGGEVRPLLRILAADMFEHGIPSLATPAGQRIVEDNLDDVSFVVFDNVSTLCASDGAENDAESWQGMQDWLLRLRRLSVTTCIVHHDGKNGSPRGTSKRDDILTTDIQLRRPNGYSPSEGARFEVHVTKGRALYGAAGEPFEARLVSDPDGRATWVTRELERATEDRVLAMVGDGVTKQRDIAKELGVGVGTVNRALKRLREEGKA